MEKCSADALRMAARCGCAHSNGMRGSAGRHRSRFFRQAAGPSEPWSRSTGADSAKRAPSRSQENERCSAKYPTKKCSPTVPCGLEHRPGRARDRTWIDRDERAVHGAGAPLPGDGAIPLGLAPVVLLLSGHGLAGRIVDIRGAGLRRCSMFASAGLRRSSKWLTTLTCARLSRQGPKRGDRTVRLECSAGRPARPSPSGRCAEQLHGRRRRQSSTARPPATSRRGG